MFSTCLGLLVENNEENLSVTAIAAPPLLPRERPMAYKWESFPDSAERACPLDQESWATAKGS